MSLLKKIFGNTTNPIEAIGKAGDALFTQDEERLQLRNDLEEIKQKPMLMQALANVTSANHRSTFVAGGRPALIWVSALGLFFFYPIKYLFGTIMWVKHSWGADAILAYPFDGVGLMELVSMLLGLGIYRTAEKLAGVAK